MEITVVKDNKCTGCGACACVCPTGALRMERNDIGETVPSIDDKICINCQKCIHVCPVLQNNHLKESILGYAAYRTNTEGLLMSASGGVASVMGEKVIENAGSVWGVRFNEQCKAVFDCAEHKEELESFKGSKYVYVEAGETFKKVGEQLKLGKEVLFIGLPCQVSGCLNYLDSKKIFLDKLTTIDLLCHGVPPAIYLSRELSFLKQKYRWNRITEVKFRCNRYGYDFNFAVYNDNILLNKWSDRRSFYFYSFLQGISIRNSCYQCDYAKSDRCGDLSIGDYPGFEKKRFLITPTDKVKNISVILVNTEKGKALLQRCKGDLEICQCSFEDINNACTGINQPCKKNDMRDEFLHYYKKYNDFSKAIRRTIGMVIFYNCIIRYINYIMRKFGFPIFSEK